MNHLFAKSVLAAAVVLLTPLATAQAVQVVAMPQPAALKVAAITDRFFPSFERGTPADSGNQSDDKWFSISSSARPDPSVAWVMALGFLGLVILRRTRSH